MGRRRGPILTGALALALIAVMAVPAGAAAPDVEVRSGAEPAAGATRTWFYGRQYDDVLWCDWNGDGVDTLAVFRPQTGTWHIRNAPGGGNATISFRFGSTNGGERPLCGDWNGDGRDTPGIYRGVDATWHLTNRLDGGGAAMTFRYGSPGPGDTPVVGDWNGDGRDTFGVRRASDGLWYLRNSLSTGPATSVFRFGSAGAGERAFVGDWDGDGDDTPGIYRPSTMSVYLRNAPGGGGANWSYAFGNEIIDAPLSGDLDGDGDDEPAVAEGRFYTSTPNSWGDGSNGNIPASSLCRIGWGTDSRGNGQYLRCDAAAALGRFNSAFRARFGENIAVDMSYRTRELQAQMHAHMGGVAVPAGTSPHGLGIAIDVFEWSTYQYGSARYNWLLANAPRFGWNQPTWARQNGSKPEYWHYEYTG
ncbi:D-alanyl-D-alanine carboxypeptidase family protein [Occultella aeris]|uniref:D-alanyl-D-alanine carboxypeptidase n=1 Tax=Occultella aeris TaxID=2761496 RepID=A0A7M4DL26_9MICO|nr:D-alanyl-D-alanine carboxypeptidase family protein [Occultella aeris]VZO37916.1 D-alanyl-D-alanine carboxypeptidase [Occultella aeris]